MKEILIKEYNSTLPLNIPFKEASNEFILHFCNGPFFEIKGDKTVLLGILE